VGELLSNRPAARRRPSVILEVHRRASISSKIVTIGGADVVRSRRVGTRRKRVVIWTKRSGVRAT
jgi:hypothetical protein